MRREAVAAVFLILMGSLPWASAAPGPTTEAFLPHEPIVIDHDGNFTYANGVVSGTGTPADPFVIAGWHIETRLGTGIWIHNVSAHFVVRDNLVDGHYGIVIEDSWATAKIHNNKVIVRARGIFVNEANAEIVDNAVIGVRWHQLGGTGIYVENSNSAILGNSVSLVANGITVDRGTHEIRWNDIHHVGEGIHAHWSVASTIEANIVTYASGIGVRIDSTQHVAIHGNLVANGGRGIEIWQSKDADVHNNTVRFMMGWGVLWERSFGNFTLNVVIDGMMDGVRIWNSPILMANNTVTNNLGIGFHFSMSQADVVGNVFTTNGMGVAVYGGSVPHLRGNLLVNNTVGFDIPYESRQAILHMEGNFVNGINVDGTVDASQKTFFYKAANVTLQGAVRDSGFSAGYYGSLSAQGQIVLYEVDTATINASILGHAKVGVGVVNSFNVAVQNSLIVNTQVGVKAEVLPGKLDVPACVVSVKDTNITIEVDPPQTIGIDVGNCFGIVSRVNVSVVDVGIRVGGQGRAIISNSTVFETRVGLDVAGQPGEIVVSGNLITKNRIGARFAGTHGVVESNVFLNNSDTAVRMESGASLRFQRNNLTGNGQGLVDARLCAGPGTCSSVEAEQNVFFQNRGDGARVNGDTRWRDDVFLQNRGTGLVLTSEAYLRGVVARENDDNGAHIVGTFTIRDSTFDANGGNGAFLRGSGELRDSTFRHNEYAGIRIYAVYVTALELNVSHNFDGILFDEVVASASPPATPTIGVADVFRLLPSGPLYGPDPLDIHRSVLVGNTRDAIRAGAAVVNATYNYWGTITGPSYSVGDEVGAYRNGVSPYVRTTPYYTDPDMTTTGPIFLL